MKACLCTYVMCMFMCLGMRVCKCACDMCVLNRLLSWRYCHDLTHIFEKLLTSRKFWSQYWVAWLRRVGSKVLKLLRMYSLSYEISLVSGSDGRTLT